MGHRERQAAHQRAFEKGSRAARDGQPITDNPYKPLGGHRHLGGSQHGEWSLYPSWASGHASVGRIPAVN